jgi:hypothetical protein
MKELLEKMIPRVEYRLYLGGGGRILDSPPVG